MLLRTSLAGRLHPTRDRRSPSRRHPGLRHRSRRRSRLPARAQSPPRCRPRLRLRRRFGGVAPGVLHVRRSRSRHRAAQARPAPQVRPVRPDRVAQRAQAVAGPFQAPPRSPLVRRVGHEPWRRSVRISSSSHWALTSSTTSSPMTKGASDRGTTTWPSRTRATTAAPRGRTSAPNSLPRTGELRGQRHLHEPGVAAFELQQADERSDGHGLLDEPGEQMRCRHCHVHAPHLVEEPVVLRVVHPCDDAWNRETPAWRAVR